jgi:aryl-alcohol dehydrogenase-like predicted oxidoreductase
MTGAIVGARNAKQVEEMMGAPDFRLSDAEIAEIEEHPNSTFAP